MWPTVVVPAGPLINNEWAAFEHCAICGLHNASFAATTQVFIRVVRVLYVTNNHRGAFAKNAI